MNAGANLLNFPNTIHLEGDFPNISFSVTRQYSRGLFIENELNMQNLAFANNFYENINQKRFPIVLDSKFFYYVAKTFRFSIGG